jgi:hypothetical protein
MAGIKPGFITGANARVKLDGVTLAYCTDLNFTVDVATIPIEVIGTYEVKSYEPVAYSVNGSFSVIRYTSKDGSANPHEGAAASGTPADKLVGPSGNSVGKQLDPGRILTSSTFDIEIHQVAANSETTTAANSTYKIQDCRVTRRSSSLNKRGVMVDSYAFVGVLGGDTDDGQVTTVSHSGQKDLT